MKRRDPFWALVAVLCVAFAAVFVWGMRSASADEMTHGCVSMMDAIEEGQKQQAEVYFIDDPVEVDRAIVAIAMSGGTPTAGATGLLFFAHPYASDLTEIFFVVGDKVCGLIQRKRNAGLEFWDVVKGRPA